MEIHEDGLPGAVQEPETDTVDHIKQLETKVAQLERAVDSHAVIDQAIGVIVAVARMTPAQAWDLIRETSMCTNIKLRHVAELIVAWGTTGALAADIREEIYRRLNDRIVW
ncbi:ANTAR domain-containing protein [Streptomyces sp. MI02-2A]|uniref:ANTAR domain-containing protein n=1 Tax=unclassified Streptomyces TaxID=2593676 RepID=UPI001F3673E6|nr:MULTISPECIES: ANTAR domain-containing protein [unclassified Streptomyces]MDX3263802.1 ANTAR domain-containing protein [Streptomyces sp. MI02-2A]